jgi:hypothetical protein
MCRLIIFPLVFLNIVISITATIHGVPSIAVLSIITGLFHLLLAYIQVKGCFRRMR